MLLRIARGHKMTSRERKKRQGREVRTRTSHKIERQLALATTRNSPRSYNVRWSLLPSFIHSTNICIIPMFRKIASIRSQLRVLELNGAHDKLDEICAPSTDMALSFDRYPLYSVAPCLVKSKVTLHKGRTLVDLWSSHHELFLLQR
ncbi:hypothetical protein X798_04106 [Onchocerca flexuosa]|uniref:Uncharacterized protein n=1 Tax=Onchocerca flexuosa TaxID=387005 RepID=A0A238BV61_9BILA|nr:hypothetical protein X798_04106 [Onchocerca flexuosa]